MRALLLYNPHAGRAREQRTWLVEQIATVLRGNGYAVDVAATTHRGSAGAQVRTAIEDGAEVVFACGGDGTVHDVLQGVVGTSAALAVIPFGSGNALCRELKIPLDPMTAARGYARAETMDVQVGRCVVGAVERSFLVMAGAGPDGALMYRMLTVDRSSSGRWVYAVHALGLLLRARFRPFTVRYREGAGDAWIQTQAISAMALRVSSLGGIFPGVARGASLTACTMKLVLVKGPALVGLPLWFAMNWLGLERWNPLVVRADVVGFACDGDRDAVHVQVDGEWVGRLPMRVELSEQTVRVLVQTTP